MHFLRIVVLYNCPKDKYERGDIQMQVLVKKLGEQLRKECPDNDCRIFLNLYNKHEKIQEDLRGCLLSEYSVHILETACFKISVELSNMTHTNYAVMQYRKEHRQ